MSDRYEKYKRTFDIDYPAERVLRLTISTNKMNTLDESGHSDMAYIWRDIDMDKDVSAVILTGAGKTFSAGGDFDMEERMMSNPDKLPYAWKEARDLVYNVMDCGKPVISAINGVAVGAGLSAALLADISIVGKSARIIDGHTRLGVAAGDHSVICWPLLCGMARAKKLLLLCDTIMGEEAAEIGLVSMCVEDDKLQETALTIANRLVAGPPNAIRFTKAMLNHWYKQMAPAFEASLAVEMLGFAGSESREGLASFREKRDPKWDPSKCDI